MKTLAESQEKFNDLKQMFSEHFGFNALLFCVYSDPRVFKRSDVFVSKWYPSRANCPANFPLLVKNDNDLDEDDILSLGSD